jgi:hypothetical protein
VHGLRVPVDFMHDMVDFVHRISDGFFVSMQMVTSPEYGCGHHQPAQTAESAGATEVTAPKEFTQQ